MMPLRCLTTLLLQLQWGLQNIDRISPVKLPTIVVIISSLFSAELSAFISPVPSPWYLTEFHQLNFSHLIYLNSHWSMEFSRYHQRRRFTQNENGRQV
ncbi:hypothetical protein Hanom_Chr12g01177341 [Helianthus anomalus]